MERAMGWAGVMRPVAAGSSCQPRRVRLRKLHLERLADLPVADADVRSRLELGHAVRLDFDGNLSGLCLNGSG